MATWFSLSQLLLITLLGWNVCCFPAEGWSQTDPDEGGFSNTEVPPVPLYGTLPPPPTDPNHPAVSFLHDPKISEVNSRPGANSEGISSPSSFGPVEESPATYLVSETTLFRPDIHFPPPQVQSGELGHNEGNYEHGNLERETHELRFAPTFYSEPVFQPGELSNYAVVYEHGSAERETHDQGFLPVSPYGYPHAYPYSSTGAASHYGTPFDPYLYYLFFTGQLPHGTMSHFHAEHEAGRDHQDELHYE